MKQKAKHKGLNPDNLEKRLEQLLPVFKARWDKSMSEQIKDLPPFEQVSRELVEKNIKNKPSFRLNVKSK